MTDGVRIRLAHPSEYAAVGELTVAAYAADGYLDDEPSYARTLRDAASRALRAELWVAVDETGLVGSVTYCLPGSPYRELARDEDQGEFRMLSVTPTARHRGVARALVSHCLDRSTSLDHREVVICSVDRMSGAHTLYTSMGFVRAPELDWCPVPQVRLVGFRRPL